jgi:hypothetical protein
MLEIIGCVLLLVVAFVGLRFASGGLVRSDD